MNELVSLNQLVSEIKFFENQAVVSYWEIGKRLSKAKEQVGHGNWENWVDENLGYSKQTTRRLIQVYGEYSNRSTLSDLTFSKALALTSIKEEDERQEFVENHKVEDMTTRQLQAEIKEYKKNLKAKENELEAAKAGLEFKDGQIEKYSTEKSKLSAELELAKMNKAKPKIIEKEVIKEVVPSDYDDLQELVKDLQNTQKELENKLFLEREAKKEAISKLSSEQQKEKFTEQINSFAWTINNFFKNVGGLLYLTDFIDDVPASSKKLFISSARALNGWSNQLMNNIENKKEK